ncbi:hypothetical protein GUITHDRAFT_110551 [Guillardia theta CCMP2712]|uniref:Uncharacterized protein n=1 Tax=Guillardia theta (strain CCMP2712) TaxID=905079 RepID=L1J5M9_GUITC|nr:hypothetical protein GUITHDRAFT_110551 [Guillardia theta CCMP2712]EKX43429.1 hypothetical protein GUITHDRAFT_110551 [Guillardia theta CCMP2712]|eukprot:XP_005830409.1 hypothetical protein GUITHDRAFT_110551 [Guillardia theta CCMP2712]
MEHSVCRQCEDRKRKRNVFNTFPWFPGSGIPFYDFGPEDDKRVRRKQFTASLLFLDMQERVNEVLRTREEKDVEERRISARLAKQHAISFDRRPLPRVEQATKIRLQHSENEQGEDTGSGADRTRPVALNAARKGQQRATVTSQPLDNCLPCWKQNKLAPQGLLTSIDPLTACGEAFHDLVDVLARDAATSSAEKEAIQSAFILKKQSTDC